MNGKGDKQRVRWSKKYADNYNKIFKKRSKDGKNNERRAEEKNNNGSKKSNKEVQKSKGKSKEIT